MERDISTPRIICRECGKPLNCVTPTERGTAPKEGDVSICGYCGVLSLFTSDLTLEAPSPEEQEILELDPKIHYISRQIKLQKIILDSTPVNSFLSFYN